MKPEMLFCGVRCIDSISVWAFSRLFLYCLIFSHLLFPHSLFVLVLGSEQGYCAYPMIWQKREDPRSGGAFGPPSLNEVGDVRRSELAVLHGELHVRMDDHVVVGCLRGEVVDVGAGHVTASLGCCAGKGSPDPSRGEAKCSAATHKASPASALRRVRQHRREYA